MAPSSTTSPGRVRGSANSRSAGGSSGVCDAPRRYSVGLEASSPACSPICHCRASIHTGSPTSARSARSRSSPSGGDGSSRTCSPRLKLSDGKPPISRPPRSSGGQQCARQQCAQRAEAVRRQAAGAGQVGRLVDDVTRGLVVDLLVGLVGTASRIACGARAPGVRNENAPVTGTSRSGMVSTQESSITDDRRADLVGRPKTTSDARALPDSSGRPVHWSRRGAAATATRRARAEGRADPAEHLVPGRFDLGSGLGRRQRGQHRHLPAGGLAHGAEAGQRPQVGDRVGVGREAGEVLRQPGRRRTGRSGQAPPERARAERPGQRRLGIGVRGASRSVASSCAAASSRANRASSRATASSVSGSAAGGSGQQVDQPPRVAQVGRQA